VDDRVLEDVEERLSQLAHDGAVDLGRLARRLDPDLLPEVGGEPHDDALAPREELSHRHHPGAGHGLAEIAGDVADLLRVPLEEVDRGHEVRADLEEVCGDLADPPGARAPLIEAVELELGEDPFQRGPDLGGLRRRGLLALARRRERPLEIVRDRREACPALLERVLPLEKLREVVFQQLAGDDELPGKVHQRLDPAQRDADGRPETGVERGRGARRQDGLEDRRGGSRGLFGAWERDGPWPAGLGETAEDRFEPGGKAGS
jgi:hypothetical protein